MKYEVPSIEIIKFEFNNIYALSAASESKHTENDNGDNNGDQDWTDEYDPFA